MAELRQYLRPDLVFGILGAIASAWLLQDIAQLERPRAAIFPSALLWCLLVVSVAIVVQAIIAQRKADSADKVKGVADLVVPAITLILGGVLLSMVGFYLAAPVIIFVFHMIHLYRSGQPMTSRQALLKGASLAIAATVVMYLVFDLLIGLPAPSGTLF